MTEKYFKFIRMIVAGFAAVGMIIVLAGVISELSKSDADLGVKASQPHVSFADYKEFQNRSIKPVVKVSEAELEKERKKFQSAFFKHSQSIYTSLSKYSSALGQEKLNSDNFDEYLFTLLSKYDTEIKIAYLEQLDLESKALLKYADEINENKDKKVILWSEFLDWFASDFDDQLLNTEMVEATENIFLSKEMFIVFMLLIIILLLARFEISDKPKKEADEIEEVK